MKLTGTVEVPQARPIRLRRTVRPQANVQRRDAQLGKAPSRQLGSRLASIVEVDVLERVRAGGVAEYARVQLDSPCRASPTRQKDQGREQRAKHGASTRVRAVDAGERMGDDFGRESRVKNLIRWRLGELEGTRW